MSSHIFSTTAQAPELQSRLFSLWSALEQSDPDLAEHGRRTAEFSARLLQVMRPDGPLVGLVDWGAHLHDIGKIVLPRTILDKEGTLTREEWQIIRSHPVHSFSILQRLDFPAEFLQIVLLHHERFDGSGYPLGLRGEDIPFAARVLAVADVYCALISRRPYRDGYSSERALTMMTGHHRHEFDPEILAALMTVTKGAYATCHS